MKVTKPQDHAAQAIEFGIEIETMIPMRSGVSVGGYHRGHDVLQGIDATTGEVIQAPRFHGRCWRADRDTSIVPDAGCGPCEFVSPVLSGDEGLAKLREFIGFANRIGAKVNRSCGCHITLGIKTVIGTSDPSRVAEFVRKLAHIAHSHAWAVYAQTGTDRHRNNYSHRLREDVEQAVKQMLTATDVQRIDLAGRCGRGMVNFQKAFNGERGAIEFRAFAGTLNEAKVFHHLATAFGLMRRAATVECFGRFQRTATKKHSKVKDAVEALRRMWRVLGWVDAVPGRECALGLFGSLHTDFGTYRKVALEMAQQFERRFPNANL